MRESRIRHSPVKLLSSLPRLRTHRFLNYKGAELQDLIIRLGFFAIGLSPIISLSLSTFQMIPLYITGPFVVLPAIGLGIIICYRHRQYAPRAVEGLIAGVIAVTLYDLTRMPFLAAGMWPDFIPKIGTYLLNMPDQRYSLLHWITGYIWRYLGNGGGMGLAFYMGFPLLNREWDSRWSGTIYGVLIFCCLIITVSFSPNGRVYLFDPSLLTSTMGLIGHIVYGFVLGTITHYLNPATTNRRKNYLIDRRMQLSTSTAIAVVAATLCVVNFIAFNNFFEFFMSLLSQSSAGPDKDALYLARRTYLTVLVITELFFVFVIVVISIFMTHRIAGPIYAIRQHMARVREGDINNDLTLREGDYLKKELTEEYNQMLTVIRNHWAGEVTPKEHSAG